MRAATSVALIALLAAPAFAAPISSTPVEEEPSIGTQIISSAAGGAASGAVGNLLSKIESFFRRDFDERSTGALTNIVKQAQTLSPADKATVKTALMNKIGTLQTPSKRLSGSGAVGTALGGLASVGAKTAVGGLLTDIENLFRRDDAELEARAGLGGAIASSVAGGAASGLVGNLLGELEGLLKRDDGLLFPEGSIPIINVIHREDSAAPLEARAGLGGAIASSVAGGAASGLVGNLLGELESFLKRDDSALEARAPLSATSLGGSIVSSAAGGAASGLVGNLLGEIESLFRRGVTDVHDEDLYVKRDASSITSIIKQAQTLSAADKATVKNALVTKIGTLQTPSKRLSGSGAFGTALGGLASVGAKTAVGGLLTDIENLFRRDDAELEARAGLGGAIASSVAGGAASGLVGNLLGELESFLKRDDSALEARAPLSSTSLGGSLISSAAGGAASGLVGNLLGEIESLFRRGVTDIHEEELYVKRDVSSISNIIKQAQTLSASDKATVKTALMNKIGTLQTPSKRLSGSGAVGTALGGLASVGANSVVSGLLTSIENLFRRDEFELEARAGLGGAIASSVAGGAASGLVGNLLGEIESLFRRSDDFGINDLD